MILCTDKANKQAALETIKIVRLVNITKVVIKLLIEKALTTVLSAVLIVERLAENALFEN